MPRVKLASETLNTGGMSGSLDPITINGNAAGSIRMVQVDASAARRQYTPMPVPGIQTDNSGQAAANMLQTWFNSAMQFQDRQNQADADQAVLNYSKKVRDAFYGMEGEDGSFIPGYQQLEGAKAVDGYRQYEDMVKGAFADTLVGLPPAVKQKALIRLAEEKNGALRHGSTHYAQQFKVKEDNIRYEKRQDILQSIETSRLEVYLDGKLQKHLAMYPDQQQRDAAAGAIAQFTLQDTYNRTLAEKENPLVAFKATAEAAKVVLKTVSPDTRNRLNYWMAQQKDQARAAFKREGKELRDKENRAVISAMPSFFSTSMEAGRHTQVIDGIETIRKRSDDAEKASKAVVSSLQGSFNSLVADKKLITPNSRVDRAVGEWERLIDAGVQKHLQIDEFTKMEEYIRTDLPKKIFDDQAKRDDIQIEKAMGFIRDPQNAGKPFPELPRGTLPSKLEQWDRIKKQVIEERVNGVDPKNSYIRSHAADLFREKLITTGLDKEDMDRALQMVADGQMGMDVYAAIRAADRKVKSPESGKAPYRSDPEYEAATKFIDAYDKAGLFNPDESRPRKTKEDAAAWEMESKLQRAAAVRAMDQAARAASVNGTSFSAKDWWIDYNTNVLNKGNIVKRGFWSTLFQSPSTLFKNTGPGPDTMMTEDSYDRKYPTGF